MTSLSKHCSYIKELPWLYSLRDFLKKKFLKHFGLKDPFKFRDAVEQETKMTETA